MKRGRRPSRTVQPSATLFVPHKMDASPSAALQLEPASICRRFLTATDCGGQISAHGIDPARAQRRFSCLMRQRRVWLAARWLVMRQEARRCAAGLPSPESGSRGAAETGLPWGLRTSSCLSLVRPRLPPQRENRRTMLQSGFVCTGLRDGKRGATPPEGVRPSSRRSRNAQPHRRCGPTPTHARARTPLSSVRARYPSIPLGAERSCCITEPRAQS
jgi:hypothetical protein